MRVRWALLLFLIFSVASATRIQHGEIIDDIDTTQVKKILEVNTSQAFILFTQSVSSDQPSDIRFIPTFENSTYISFSRYGTASANIFFQVIESDDFRVQRGEITVLSGDYETNVTINETNTSASFAIAYASCDSTTNANNYGAFFIADIFNSTLLQLKRVSAAPCDSVVSWQVVEWKGAKVQHNVTQKPESQPDVLVFLDDEVNLSRSILIFTFSSDGGTATSMSETLTQGSFLNSTTLNFTIMPGTTSTGTQKDISWYVVEVPNARATGNATTLTDTTVVNQPLPNLEPIRTFYFSSRWNTDTGIGTFYQDSLYLVNLTNSTTISFTKSDASEDTHIQWYALEIPDYPPKYYANFDDSSGSVNEDTIINMSVFWKDDIRLGYALFRTNKSGSWQTDKITGLSSSREWSNFTFNTTNYPGKYICWNVWANDSFGNWNNTMPNHCFFVQDTEPPTYSSNFDNSSGTVEAGEFVKASAYWYDNNQLKNASLETNRSGVFTSYDWLIFSTTPPWANFTISTSGLGSNYLCWKIFAYDIANNLNNTMDETCFSIADTQAPNWKSNSTSIPVSGFETEHRVYWTDAGGFKEFLFSFDNCTGNFVNDSWKTITGTSGWTNISKTISYTEGCTIRWQIWMNDTSRNINSTKIFTYTTLKREAAKWSNNSTNDTLAGGLIEHRVYWEDNAGISGYIFSFDNCTGNFVNDSWKHLNDVKTIWTNISKTSNFTADCQIRWRVWVNDSVSNLWNVTRIFTYTTTLQADLVVGSITFNTTNPKENEWVLIQANISNKGPSDANNTLVWLNETDSNGLKKGLGELRVNISKNQWKWVNITARFGQGTHTINVTAFAKSPVIELDSSSNSNQTNLTISAWAYFYGNVTGQLFLAKSNDTILKKWIPGEIEGTTYYMDADAGFDLFNPEAFTTLTEIRTLDRKLGIENFTDSIEKLYDSDNNGVFDNTHTFYIHGEFIPNIPVVNVTPDSPWLVGIIWDRNDGGTSYDGTQDVAFLTEIKGATQGTFGYVNYEAKVPSNLKFLTGSINLIATRGELK